MAAKLARLQGRNPESASAKPRNVGLVICLSSMHGRNKQICDNMVTIYWELFCTYFSHEPKRTLHVMSKLFYDFGISAYFIMPAIFQCPRFSSTNDIN